MNDIAIGQLFASLWDDILEEDQFYIKKPLLAHYTSIEVLESILRNDEVWFSSPLFMNDIAEVKFGIFVGIPIVNNSKEIEDSCHTKERAHAFRESFDYYYNQFANYHVMDTFIFCLSEHERQNTDGSLSMWRGYGSNGNGIAIVFNAANLTVTYGSPLIIAKVHYITRDELVEIIKSMVLKFAAILDKANIPDDKLDVAAFSLFERIKQLSLFIKHRGFQEEKEWRIVYMADRDPYKKLEAMVSYWIGPSGIEPKLKLKIKPVNGIISDDISLTKIVDHIILGPSTSSPLVKETISRMIDKLGKSEMKEKIHMSNIPFRAK